MKDVACVSRRKVNSLQVTAAGHVWQKGGNETEQFGGEQIPRV